MGSGSSTGRTKTVPHPDDNLTIVPVPTSKPPLETIAPPPSTLQKPVFNKDSPLARLQPGPLPSGWQVTEYLSLEDAKGKWAKHCAASSRTSRKSNVERHIKRAPTRVALNVLPVWEEADFDLKPGDVVMGRYKVQGALDPPQRAFEVIDTVDDAACLLKVQPASLASEVLQTLAKHEALRQHAADGRFFLHYKDAFLAPETGNWAVVVEQERSTLRSWFFSGSDPTECLVRKIGQVASASLQALDRLHHACYIHTDVSLDSIVLDMNGCWKLARLENAKSQPRGGGGVTPRTATDRRFRPPEVLVGCLADEKSDVFDLGIALFEAATGSEVMEALKGSSPGLLQEIDGFVDLLGALPIELIAKSPEKELICTPEGGFVRPAKRGSRDVLEVVMPDAVKLVGSVAYKLEQGKLAGNSSQLRELRAFIQRLLQADPAKRPTAAEALNDAFLTHLAAGGKMKRASITGKNTATIAPKVADSREESSTAIEDDEELQKLLKEGEGLLSSTGGGILGAPKEGDEPDEPIDTKRRLSYAKIDVASSILAANKAGVNKVTFSSQNETHSVERQSRLTMLAGTVKDEQEGEEQESKPVRLKRQQTGYADPIVLEDEESDEDEKHVEFKVDADAQDTPAHKIRRQQTQFERGSLGDDDDEEEVEENEVR